MSDFAEMSVEDQRDFVEQFASCGPENISLFYPVGNNREAQQKMKEAKDVCRTCLVRKECAYLAISTVDIDRGIRGGMRPAERRRMRIASLMPGGNLDLMIFGED